MPWFLITVKKEFVKEPALIERKKTGPTYRSEACEAVLGEYKHDSEEQAIEDAAYAHEVSPLILNAYKLMD